jgi:hypothetical protein
MLSESNPDHQVEISPASIISHHETILPPLGVLSFLLPASSSMRPRLYSRESGMWVSFHKVNHTELSEPAGEHTYTLQAVVRACGSDGLSYAVHARAQGAGRKAQSTGLSLSVQAIAAESLFSNETTPAPDASAFQKQQFSQNL